MKKIFAVCVMMCVVSSAVFAQAGYDIKEMTPAVKAALESRKARFSDLKALKTQGDVGENNRGYVDVLSGGTGFKDLVNAENVDRRLVYEAIVEQNGLGAGDLSVVEKVFARVQRGRTRRGASR